MRNKLKVILYIILKVCLFITACNKNPSGVEPPGSDAWRTSTPQAQGLDPESLSRALESAEGKGFINSLLIIRNGYLVTERYYNGYGKENDHLVMSVSKSFMSAMTGIAFELGYLDSLGQRMLDFFPEYDRPELDPRKGDITIRHLLSMRAGFASDHEVFSQVYDSANWIETTIDLPLMHSPGESFGYNTFETHLLSGILTRATGMSSLDFAREHLLEPLGIVCQNWEQDPQGFYFGGSGMYFTPRDMARLGYLYLRGGELGGRQIVPQDWVESSLRDHICNPYWEWGVLKELGYGWLWWLGKIDEVDIFTALGHGGQYILCVPDVDMIIVVTSNSDLGWEQADQQEREVLDIIAEHILPAVIDEK